MALALFALLAALWAGWIRLGWPWPVLQPNLPISHGPLMVSGFLGTLIAVERAVALRKRWTYIPPLLTGAGGLLLALGMTTILPPLMITLGSVGLLVVFGVIIHRQPALFTYAMAGGVLAWVVGNLLWLQGWPIYHIVLWWAAFLVLTIAGERLELGRLIRQTRRTEELFLAAAALFLAGLVVVLPAIDLGTRISGAGLLALSAWLLRYDIARFTIRKKGLPRYAAACLLAGYVWLAFAGGLALFFGAAPAGARYDALLHAIFLGFVFSMIFGHAPIIFPAVLKLPVTFRPVFYVHLALLHFSLALRLSGDFLGYFPARLWGGLLNGIAILLFLATTLYVSVRSSRQALHNQAESISPSAIPENSH
jgi:hypothetical protein